MFGYTNVWCYLYNTVKIRHKSLPTLAFFRYLVRFRLVRSPKSSILNANAPESVCWGREQRQGRHRTPVRGRVKAEGAAGAARGPGVATHRAPAQCCLRLPTYLLISRVQRTRASSHPWLYLLTLFRLSGRSTMLI